MRKNNVNKPLRQFMASMSAKAEADNEMRNIHNKSSRSSSGQFQNVSVEEWDCPRPGSKKYMPKSVKDNIKKNLKKVTTDSRSSADSVQVR